MSGTVLGAGDAAASKATSFLLGRLRAAGEESHKAARARPPSAASNSLRIHDPSPGTLIVSWKLSSHFTDESLRLESHLHSPSPYSGQAAPHVSQPALGTSASEQNFPCCHGHPPGEACPTLHPWRSAGGLAPPPRTERWGLSHSGGNWSHW